MEGTPGLKLNPHESTRREQGLLILVIIIFHVVGLIGFAVPAMRPLFLQIVPWHILLMLIVIVCSHRPLEGKLILFALLIFISSIIVEWLGVHKQLIFGNYTYGQTLGFKADEIPLIIGVNWFLLIYSAGVLMQRTRIRSILIKVIVGAIILVLLDLLIEPVAQHFDYWHWSNNIIPLKNYLGWFLVSGVMLFAFEKCGFRKQGVVAPVFLLVQFVFFMALLLV
ncbi:MAG: carotenoid biosynthesis protein [Sphingobacteriales bacterium]